MVFEMPARRADSSSDRVMVIVTVSDYMGGSNITEEEEEIGRKSLTYKPDPVMKDEAEIRDTAIAR